MKQYQKINFIKNVKKKLGFKGKHYDPYYIKLLNDLIAKNKFNNEQQQLLIKFVKAAKKQQSLSPNKLIKSID